MKSKEGEEEKEEKDEKKEKEKRERKKKCNEKCKRLPKISGSLFVDRNLVD